MYADGSHSDESYAWLITFTDVPDDARNLFPVHGVVGPVRWLHEGGDEWIFLVTTRGAANMNEAELTRALQAVLHAKVSVTTDGGSAASEGRQNGRGRVAERYRVSEQRGQLERRRPSRSCS